MKIAIDPKGDLGDLLLTFPKLRAEDFQPWVDPDEAGRQGLTTEQFAAQACEQWRKGLAAWDQSGERIKRLRDTVDLAIYAPGSPAGRPLPVLRSFKAPGPSLTEQAERYRERVVSTVSGLLALLGIVVDPITSREHILLANVLDHSWRTGHDLDMAGLIQAVQSPPFQQVGVLDLETFFPAKERFSLAMKLNNLLASPGFTAWLEGDSLDVAGLLYTGEGKPRLSAAGHAFDRKQIDEIISGLANRVFVMNNIHDDKPVVFQTRWALSYLRGPLTREQIQALMAPRKQASVPMAVPEVPAFSLPAAVSSSPSGGTRPVMPPNVPEFFVPRRSRAQAGELLQYSPSLLGVARLH